MTTHQTWKERALQNQKLHGERVEARQRERMSVPERTASNPDRVLDATKGSQFGAILACAYGIDIPGPRFVGKAVVTSDGFVTCNFVDGDGRSHHGAFVGALSDVVQNANRLADHLSLTVAARQEMFATLRNWVAVNYSGQSFLQSDTDRLYQELTGRVFEHKREQAL